MEATPDDPKRAVGRKVAGRDMMPPRALTPAQNALARDAEDLCALLNVLADAAAQRGDEDTRRTLRVAARYAEGIAEGLERFAGAEVGHGA